MKANRKFKTDETAGYPQVVGMIIALMLTIVIGVMIYYEVSGSVADFSEQTETFTGYTVEHPGSATTITLGNSPTSTSTCNVTLYNATTPAELYPTYTLNAKQIHITAANAVNFTQVNVTYTSHAGTDAALTTTMAGTVFVLLPIIALVIVAAIILGVVLGFGGSGKSGGGL
jgi:hypothetical protein